MANPLEVLDLIDLIRDFYGRDAKGGFKFNPSERASALWCDDLADLPIAELALAFKQHRNSPGGEWPPSPNQLRQFVTTLTRPELPSWADAWEEVWKAVTSLGYYRKPQWSHPLIAKTVDSMGGWQTMCQIQVDNLSTERAQFRQMYESHASRATRHANLLPDVRALAVKNGALPAPTEETLQLPAPVETPRLASPAPRSLATVLPMALKTPTGKPKNADDDYRERVRRAAADPSGPDALAFEAQAEKMRQAAKAWAERQNQEAQSA